jgi:hypothetical protein
MRARKVEPGASPVGRAASHAPMQITQGKNGAVATLSAKVNKPWARALSASYCQARGPVATYELDAPAASATTAGGRKPRVALEASANLRSREVRARVLVPRGRAAVACWGGVGAPDVGARGLPHLRGACEGRRAAGGSASPGARPRRCGGWWSCGRRRRASEWRLGGGRIMRAAGGDTSPRGCRGGRGARHSPLPPPPHTHTPPNTVTHYTDTRTYHAPHPPHVCAHAGSS